MPATNLGTLNMMYATYELQNPLPRQTLLYKANMRNPKGTRDACVEDNGLPLSNQHCLRGKRFTF